MRPIASYQISVLSNDFLMFINLCTKTKNMWHYVRLVTNNESETEAKSIPRPELI